MFQKVKRVVGVILLVAFLFAFFYMAYVKIADRAPTFFGFSLQRVSSDSMEPALDSGEIVIVKKVDPSTLELGDVIAYRANKGIYQGERVTHQISKEPYEKDGVYYFTTRGIKPEAVDDPEISEEQVIGEVLYKIPFAGTLFDFFTEWYGVAAFAVILFIIFSNEIIGVFNKLTQKKEQDDDFAHKNAEDIEQSEKAMAEHLNEFDGIITELDDPDL